MYRPGCRCNEEIVVRRQYRNDELVQEVRMPFGKAKDLGIVPKDMGIREWLKSQAATESQSASRPEEIA